MGSFSNGDGFRAAQEDKMEPMAIIGMATRFPQDADSNENLWKFLLQGRSAHAPFPKDRINPDGHYHPDPEHGGTFAVKGGHFLAEDPAYFDAPFFSATRSEVLALDPQQRVIMENVYQALENSGLPMSKVTSSNTSVFVSGFNHDHLATLNVDSETKLKYKPTGTTNSLLSNRVSWFFDFKAPSLTLDTACSSSMVAFHLACQSLRCGESDMSVVSGVTMISFPTDITSMSHHGFLSPDGRCFSFDHRANGYARGEGVGSVIIKRLSDAIKDGDTIRAVIRGTAVNQDGRTPGISLPSSAAQEILMRKIYADAGLGFEDTMMVEAHGTGTSAGDPLEATAIGRVFGPSRKDTPLYIGALKSGIGHLEGGAGIAGIIKGVLVLESGIIPPNVNFEKVNPKIPMDKLKIQFPLANTPWPKAGLRRISINSFGVGGTNGHTILDDAYNYLNSRGLKGLHNTAAHTPTLEEISSLVAELHQPLLNVHIETGEALQEHNGLSNGYSETHKIETNEKSTNGVMNGHSKNNTAECNGASTNGLVTNGSTSNCSTTNGNGVENHSNGFAPIVPKLFVLTSFDESGVERNAVALAKYFGSIKTPTGSNENEYLENFAYTMTKKRSVFPWRSYAVASGFKHLAETLQSEHGLSKPVRVRATPKVCYVFTGQGAQWYAMGQELLIYPVFRESLEDATVYMKSIGAEWSLLDELSLSKEETHINQPWLAHPSCAALQIALVDLLASWGVLPARVVGHSSGEIAAAYCAGKLSRQAAWKVAYYRGFVSAKKFAKNGAMMAVGLTEANLQPYLEKINEEIPGEMIIACYNSPKNNTISGDEQKIDALKKVLDADNVFARKLNVVNAYHSAHMKEVSDEYLDLMGNLLIEVTTGHMLHAPDVKMFSTVTGGLVEQDTLAGQYWVDNMVSPVRFTDTLLVMCYSRLSKGQASLRMNTSTTAEVADFVVEIGPHSALQSAIKETLAAKNSNSGITYLHALSRTNPSVEIILCAAGLLSSHGFPVDVLAVNQSSKAVPTIPRTLVQLPSYRFNHSERVWHESRLSKNYRFREFPRHDLFGAPVPDWNVETPKWRNMIRLSEQPWLRDHVVTGAFVYPGVGYLIAVIEACRQLADSKLRVTGFRMRDISLKRALIIPDDKDGIETSLVFSRMDESSLWGSSVWKKFQMLSYNPVGDDWIEHCTGYVAMDYETPNGPIDSGREAEQELLTWAEALKSAKERCTHPEDMEGTYDNLITAGLVFGPLFKNLTEVKSSPDMVGEVVGTVTVPDVAKAMPKNYMHSHLIHPATMDSMLHLFIASVMNLNGKKNLDRAMVPTFIKDVWISADISSEPSTKFQGHGKSTLLAFNKHQSDVTIWDGTTSKPQISIRGLRATPLESVESGPGHTRKLCHNIAWNADADLITTSSFDDVTVMSKDEIAEEKYWTNRFQLSSMLWITDALDELKDFDADALTGHFRKYYNWLTHFKSCLEADQITGLKLSEWQEYAQKPELKEALHKQVEGHNANGRLCVRMGSNIVKFLKQEVDALHLMFGQDDILDRVYEQVVKLGDLPAMQQAYLKAVGHTSTNLNILEVGAGTGSSTAAMLQGLAPVSDDGESRETSSIRNYTFTDISAGFFEKAKEKFKQYRDIMEFKTLNAEKDIATQGFVPASYDYIMAGNVIHATADLRKTLSNLQMLLKPGGKLILQEATRIDFLWSSIAFGQLPGWWLSSEPYRVWGPLIPVERWGEVLQDSGFSGVDLALGDSQDSDLRAQSIIVSTAISTSGNERSIWEKAFIVTTTPTTDAPTEIVSGLKIYLEQTLKVPNCTVINYLDLATADLSSAVCISVMELERPVLENLTEDEFINVRQFLATCGGMVWVTGDNVKNPQLNMITGLTRSVRWERDIDETNLTILAVVEPQLSTQSLIENIATLYKQQFVDYCPLTKINGEYQLKNGQFLTARLVDSDDANKYLNTKFSAPAPVMQPLGSAKRPLKLVTSSPGLLNKLEFVTDPVYNEPLGETEVEIEIKAVGLNFRDLMIAMGEHMAYSLGNEAAGVISRVGSRVDLLKVGDRVVYLCGLETTGCFHTYGRVDQSPVIKIPDNLSYEVAASLSCIYATTIYGLVDASRLQKGEKILIHAAAGGVGQSAIMFAQYVGAEVFATVSTPEKRELLVKEYGIPEDHIFSSRDLTFFKGIMRVTNNKGVDVVLNSLAGEALRRSWDLLAPFGRFVEIGKKDAQANGKIELHPFLRNVTMTSVELPTMMRHRPSLIRRLTEDTIRLYTEGAIREPVPLKIMNYTQIEEGLRTLQSGKGMGKMVFVPSPDDIVPIIPEQSSPYDLKADASYILGGGLGGIGRSMARWMVSRGARNLIFLSRSGKITEPVNIMIEELESKGCKINVVTCDVSDKTRLSAVLEECKATMPPIKGCIQGAMTLKDGMFENMSYEAFQMTVKPKVQGSWNLHELLPLDMDFFVLLSSATGIIGNRSQANYAAGNTYQDALAQHRLSRGLPAASIDLGTVLSVGYVAENKDKTIVAKHLGTILEVLREDEIHCLIEYLMDPRSNLNSSSCQLVSGLTNASMYHQRGIPTPTYLANPLFKHLATISTSRVQSSSEDPSFIVQAKLLAATSHEEASSIVAEGVRAKLASLLAIPLDNIDPARSISSNGVDSLVAMEFRAYLAKDIGADIPLLDIMGTASLLVISQKIASLSKLVQVQSAKAT